MSKRGDELIQQITALLADRADLPELLARWQDSNEQQLASAEEAYAHAGDLTALYHAVSLLRYQKAGEPWPEWVIAGVADQIANLAFGDTLYGPPGRKGRQADELRWHHENARDFHRARVIDRFLKQGFSDFAAHKAASRELQGSRYGGTPKVMGQSHKRFHERATREPWRYYPLISGSRAGK